MEIAITPQASEAMPVAKHQKQTGDVLQIRPVSCVHIIFSFFCRLCSGITQHRSATGGAKEGVSQNEANAMLRKRIQSLGVSNIFEY